MNKEKALKLYDQLKAMCPGLVLAGSALRSKQDSIQNLDLILVCKIFPMHLLPVGEMDADVNVGGGGEILRFKYRDEKIYIHRADEKNLGAMKLHLTGPREYGIYLRSKAKKLGMELNQNGLFKKSVCVAAKTEKEIIKKLGLKYLEPVERDRFRSIKM